MYFDSLDWLKENTQEKEGWDFLEMQSSKVICYIQGY